MTELQLAIGHLKETISVGKVLLTKLEIQQAVAEEPKAPEFPSSLSIVKDNHLKDLFVIGLNDTNLMNWSELPSNFRGRACFDKQDLRDIVSGIQTLLGDE